MILNKETLQNFIANYAIPFDSLSDEPYQQAYLDGIKDVLSDLESTFLSDMDYISDSLKVNNEETHSLFKKYIANPIKNLPYNLDYVPF